jgi:EAL domain-containing protein (putative c-di-GMP-specific phosphodiesterase class I)
MMADYTAVGAPTRQTGGHVAELDRDEHASTRPIGPEGTNAVAPDRAAPDQDTATSENHTAGQNHTATQNHTAGQNPTATQNPTADQNHDGWSDTEWSRALAGVLADFTRPSLAAQPVVDLSTGGIAGYELLARFGDSREAPPNIWFRNADRLGFATALTARVLTHAFALRSQLPPGTFLAVNIEPHLLSDPAVIHALRGLPDLDQIVIELTGHTAVRDDAALHGAVEWIRAAGGLIAVDDAGTGYAGLRQLITVRPDIVKVDRELIAGIDTDAIRRGAVSLLSDLVGRMGAKVLAEGVETHAELQVLASLGIPMAQGWLLSRPGSPWPTVDAATVDMILTATERATHTDQIAPLIHDCGTMNRTAWCASNVPPPHGDRRTIVVVDGHDCPVGVVTREAKGTRYLAPVISVLASTSPVEAARRAMARAACHRGVPLVCVDDRGRATGVVDVADLVDAAIKSGAL